MSMILSIEGPVRGGKTENYALILTRLFYNSEAEVILRKTDMTKSTLTGALLAAILCLLFFAGCVERQLTIHTEPPGAVVSLNDEEIGETPVTVSFEWYGDYNVRISKEGYQTMNTHRLLKGPWYDHFPFDFFAQVLCPKRIVDEYEWFFELEPKQLPTREALIEQAENTRQQM
jgi:hypothetical protein